MNVDPWAAYWARKYSWALKGRPFLSYEDLTQSAMLGIWIAKQTFKEECGSWAQYSGYFIKNELRALIGIKQEQIPALTLSLDAPLTALDEDGEDGTLLDIIKDDSVPDVEDTVVHNEMQQTVREAIESLPDATERQVIELHRFEGKSITETAQALEITENDVRRLDRKARFQHLARDPRILALIRLEDLTPYYRRIGITAFNTTNTSITEQAAIWRIEEGQRIKEIYNQHGTDNDKAGTTEEGAALFLAKWK